MTTTIRTVTQDEADIRLDRWIRRHFPNIKQGAIQKFCRTGWIRVDGRRAQASGRLSPLQKVQIPIIKGEVNAAKPRYVIGDKVIQQKIQDLILYQDDDLLILDKPPGLAVQGGSHINNRHIDAMLGEIAKKDGSRPRLVHRLDRDTSGILLLAWTAGIAAKLAALFRNHDIEKIYWALVVGRPFPASGRIDLPLARIGVGPEKMIKIVPRNDENAMSALTDYRVVDAAARTFSWLELSPLTGRTHQLRVHCQAIGTPILGDKRYGLAEVYKEGFENKLHLHARKLSFPHPAGGRIDVEAKLPSHMRDSFRRLGFSVPRASCACILRR